MSDQDFEVHPQRLSDLGDDEDGVAEIESLLLDFKHARRLLGISESTLYRLAPRIPGSMKLGGTWRFNRQMLLDFISCKGPGSPPKKKR